MEAIDTLLVSFNPENRLMLVGRKRRNQAVDIVNAFEGDEAERLYNSLLEKKVVESEE